MKPALLRSIAVSGLALALLAGGAAVGMLVADDSGRIGPLEAGVATLRAANDRLTAERNRLRVERDEFEARLAAERAPAVCPEREVSTGDTELLPSFAVSYPCGWHVVLQVAQTTAERAGLTADVLLLSRLPVAIHPGPAPPADVELADWTDAVEGDDDELPPLEEWVADDRAALATVDRDEPAEAGDGFEGHLLEGTIDVAGEPAAVLVAVWTFEDLVAGKAHVVRVFALEPSARVRAAVERMLRTFRVLPTGP